MAVSPPRYTQQEIDDLIGCPKVVSEPPKREMKLDRGHYHAYQLVTESVRLGEGKTTSDPYHAGVCGKQTLGPCLDLLWTSSRDDRGCD